MASIDSGLMIPRYITISNIQYFGLCSDLLGEFRKEEGRLLSWQCQFSSFPTVPVHLFIETTHPLFPVYQAVSGCLWSGNQEKEWKGHFYLRVIPNGSQEECRNACLSSLSQCTHHPTLPTTTILPSLLHLSLLGIEPRTLQCSSTDQHPGPL